jgi:hypothetical protein
MALTDQQVERYSRQIIVPGIGGRAQERLLGSTVKLVAEPADAERVLPYLVGAGVGRTAIHALGDRRAYEAIFQPLHDLNPDVAVGFAEDEAAARSYGLMFALIASTRAARAVARIARANSPAASIIARLDVPSRIAILPAAPPCVLCADADLLGTLSEAAAIAGMVAMVATAEAFKLLAASGGEARPAVIELNGYAARTRALSRRADVRCACGTT